MSNFGPVSLLSGRAASSFCRRLGLAAIVAFATLLPAATANGQRRILTRTLPRVWNDAVSAGKVRVVEPDKATAVAKNAEAIQLRPGQVAVAQVEKATRIEVRARPGAAGSAVDTVRILPFGYLTVDATGGELRLRHTYVTESVLRYDRTDDTFKGSLLIALENSAEQQRRDSLPVGVFRMTVAAPSATVDPSQLEWRFTSLSNRVAVSSRAPLDSVRVDIVPNFDSTRSAVWLPVQPALTIPNFRKTASGFGIQTVPVPVRLVGATIRDSIRVTLTSDRGSFENDQIVIGPSGAATARLRTEGRGIANISAAALGIEAARESISFGWPLAFLGFSLAGGAVGAVAARLSRTSAKGPAIVRAAVVGMLIGFVVAVVYVALGINLLAIKVGLRFFDEAAIFALALLGGALGIPLFAKAKSAGRARRTSGP